VATLTRIFGIEHLSLAEDVVQETLARALRMMFVCCHPLIPAAGQVALALKTLCGFSPAEP
jgi:RNA polymerase sigma-70 factor (ECF subfamily)